MTEEQARSKWCPIGQISMQVYIGIGRSELCECVASNCMMWVEDFGEQTVYSTGNATALNMKTVPAQGHCGLGGR